MPCHLKFPLPAAESTAVNPHAADISRVVGILNRLGDSFAPDDSAPWYAPYKPEMSPFSFRNNHDFTRNGVSDLRARSKTAGIQYSSVVRIPNPAFLSRDSGGVFGWLCFRRTGRLVFLRCRTLVRAGVDIIGGAERRESGDKKDRECCFHGR